MVPEGVLRSIIIDVIVLCHIRSVLSLALSVILGMKSMTAQDIVPRKSTNDIPLDSISKPKSNGNGGKETDKDLETMFYPIVPSIYTMFPGSMKTLAEAEYYRKPYSQVLYASKYVPNVNGHMISQIRYYYHTDGNRIVSSSQEYYDFVHNKVEAYSDTLTLLVIPPTKAPIKWVEHKQGESYSCVAKYIYLLSNGMKHKVVKIEKTKIGKSKQVEWEYWKPLFGRILSYVKIGNGKPIVTERIKVRGMGGTVTEIPM